MNDKEDIDYKISDIENYEVNLFPETHDVQLNFRLRKMISVFIEKKAALKFDENLNTQ